MNQFKKYLSACLVLGLSLISLAAAKSADSFSGRWELKLPNQGKGWMSLQEQEGEWSGSILWGGGSVKALSTVELEGDKIIFTRKQRIKTKASAGKAAAWKETVETTTASLEGNKMSLEQVLPKSNGSGVKRATYSAKRMSAIPPQPDLKQARFGEGVELFNGKDLSGWKLLHASHKNGWSAKDGVLVNNAVQGQHGYGNLMTEAKFEDFNLKLDFNVPAKSNSGIFLRGMYEVQVLDSFGRKPDLHNMGAIYSRIVPSQAAAKKAGEWQTMDITLIKQHVTVILNGITIINNKPLLGCTGGALSSDPLAPGPILLQGNHGAVSFRNIVLKPIIH
ncbi:DUF1080 domain-containing protein [Lentisphaera profundi]|uniref:DUF1080 domain-containing protein n=1 Tax=Lentisphaera profundi TaxID=1658616 RepID=A0ABY7VYS7_9BACT|nr:DUF1080 domain-containing protein [Lentisphaera profundi]WDE99330.1 DUF1080 domain-containing protein [Lentisphaera profundi]